MSRAERQSSGSSIGLLACSLSPLCQWDSRRSILAAVNLVALAAFVPIAGAMAIGIQTLLRLRVARACQRFDIEYYGSGRHKYEAFDVAWATFERAHQGLAQLAHRAIFAEQAEPQPRHSTSV
jgi:hypothetical protein